MDIPYPLRRIRRIGLGGKPPDLGEIALDAVRHWEEDIPEDGRSALSGDCSVATGFGPAITM